MRCARAQLFKKSAGDAGDVQNRGLICSGERAIRFPARGCFLQRTGLRANGLKSRPRWAEGEGGEHGCLHVECNDARRILIRQRAQNHGIYDAEDGGVGANTEGEGQDGDGGEGGILAERAQGVANVGEKALEGRPLPDFAAVVFDEGEIAEGAARGGGGFCAGHAARDEFLCFFFEVLLDLVGEIVVEAAAREEVLQPIHKLPLA